MKVLASIDIMSGKVVRLKEGKPEMAKVYSMDPEDTMRRLYMYGFVNFHIVDLDAALGYGNNSELILALLKEEGYKQVAGGIRDVESITKYLKKGADKVVVSTLALTRPEILLPYKDRLAISLDVKGENVAYEGWKKVSDLTLYEALKKFDEMGFEEFIVTSIKRDGNMSGFDRDLAKKIPYEMRNKIILAGGVLLKEINEIKELGYMGCIIGKDLYENLLGGI